MIIDNFERIRKLIDWDENEHLFFHCQVVRRGKDHPNLPAANMPIKTWFVNSKAYFDKITPDIKFLCEQYQARAYINIAPKSMVKLNQLVVSKITMNAFNGNVINPMRMIRSAAGELTPEIKKWVVDIDTRDYEIYIDILLELDSIWEKNHPEDKYRLDRNEHPWLYEVFDTLNGVHLITKPFNLVKFKELFKPGQILEGQPVDVHKNNPTILYIPECICKIKD